MRSPDDREPEGKMDADDLYREEVITDRKVGTIRVMTPITRTGLVDPKRAVHFVGQAQIMTPAGPLPLSFDIPAKSLEDAVVNFTAAAQKGIEQAMEELREYQRQQASSIVIPKGPLPGGGKVGGGGIQIP
jgi:hypothetical protein